MGAGINTFSSYISSQDVVQRFTTTTDIKQLNKMTYILSIGTATVLYLLGTSLFVFYNQNPNLLQTAQQDQIFAILYSISITCRCIRTCTCCHICSSTARVTLSTD